MDVMVVKNRLAKHLEYTLELVNDLMFVEELRQDLIFEVVASSATEQYPLVPKVPETEDALNLSVIDGQLRFPECMIVLIKDDNVSLLNETLIKHLHIDEKGAFETKLSTKFSQLFHQMIRGRDDVDSEIGISVFVFDDFGTPADNRCLTSTWQHTDVGINVLVHVLLEGRLSHNCCLERTGFKEDSGLLFARNFFAKFNNSLVVLFLISIEIRFDLSLQNS